MELTGSKTFQMISSFDDNGGWDITIDLESPYKITISAMDGDEIIRIGVGFKELESIRDAINKLLPEN